MRNFPPEKIALINIQGKILPFRGSGKIETVNTDQSNEIVRKLEALAKTYKSIVVDDYQYTMANEFMRRSTEKGYDKFTEIGRHAWDIANKVRELPQDVIVYVMCHTDRDDEGNEKIKTIGKLLDEKICLEGMATIVLKTNVTDGQYYFLTQNNGKDTVKSPAGMFPTYAIDNDLYYVDQKIRNYYGLGEFITDEEAAEIDEAAKRVDVLKDDVEGKKKRRSRKDEAAGGSESTDAAGTSSADGSADGSESGRRRTRRKAEEPAESAAVPDAAEPIEEPKRRRKSREEAREEAKEQLEEVNKDIDADMADDVIDSEKYAKAADLEETANKPARKTRKKRDEEPQAEEAAEPQAEEPATRRRRRRA